MKWRISICGVVLKTLGLVLLVAAVLKGHSLLTKPVAANSLWTSRPVLILQVECELILGLWLLSGLFAKAAWLAGILCFALFSVITLHKGLTGAATCGCFGVVHVNPWVTLLAIDLPAVLALSLFRPAGVVAWLWAYVRPVLVPGGLNEGPRSLQSLILGFLSPLPSRLHMAVTAGLVLAVLAVTTPLLALNKPAAVTATYEVLEPESWIGKALPILEYIDIGKQLQSGTWLLLFYHHDCPGCRRAIPQYEQMARDLAGNENFLRIALIEVPPYGPAAPAPNTPCTPGRLADVKQWFITTPAFVLLREGQGVFAWDETMPGLDTVIESMVRADKSSNEAKLCQAAPDESHRGLDVFSLWWVLG